MGAAEPAGDAVNLTLAKALVALIPVSVLLGLSVRLAFNTRTAGSLLQIVGSAGLLVVVLTHIAEGLQLFPSMHWGENQSAGHYLDLASAVVGITLLPLGFLSHATAVRRCSVR